MRYSHTKRWLASALIPVLALLLPDMAWAAKPAAKAAAPATAPASANFVDGIAAIVNKDVITLSQLNAQVSIAQRQLAAQKIAVPDVHTLQKQVLQRMITEELEHQEAKRLGITVSDEQVQQAAQTIASRNKITVAQLRQEIEKPGLSWTGYLNELRQQVQLDMLRQRAVDSKIFITDADVDAFLKTQQRQGAEPAAASQPGQQAPVEQARQTGPAVLGLAQILVQVPDGAPSARVQELRKKAESILTQLRGGADFASVSAASSDAPEALEGGDLGVRPANGWPDLFLTATENVPAGGVSDIVQSGNGFHILKVLTRGPTASKPAAPSARAPREPAAPARAAGPQESMIVTQTHARHILIKTSKVVTDEQAETRLNQVRERLENGQDFADLAKRYSQDSSAPQGGDLGWLSPGVTVPPFEEAMNALQPHQVSEPVKTQFGWHLIEVLERRTKNMEEEYKRMQARQALFQRRADPAFEDWVNQLRGQAYIDNRIDPKSNQGRP